MYLTLWNKDLETGHELMDSQHKELLRAANSFFIKCKMNKHRNAASEHLDFLVNYIQYHFQAEESIHIDSKYPEQKNHHALHKMISFEVTKYTVLLRDSDFAEPVMRQFYEFVIAWIKNHILVKDVEFAKYYQQYLKKQQEELHA